MKRTFGNFIRTAGARIPGLLAAAAAAGFLLAAPAFAQTIEYGALRDLLAAGNQSLINSSYNDSIASLNDRITTLEEELAEMRRLKAEYKGEDDELAEQYDNYADQIASALKALRKSKKRMENGSSGNSYEDSIDSLTKTAEAYMNAYDQTAAQLKAKEKTVEAAQSTMQSTALRYTAGLATEADMNTAANDLLQQQNELEAYRQQERAQKLQLLNLLGITDDGTVTIGPVPEPDLAAISALDFEADCERAVNNSTSVRNIRHSRANSTPAMRLKEQNEAEAMGTVRAEFTDAYNQLMVKKERFETAAAAWDSAQNDYQSLLRRQSAGLTTSVQMLEGEAKLLSAEAQYKASSMSLYQAYRDYLWMKDGID